MNNGPLKNIVDAVRDWTNEKIQPLLPGEIYETVPDQIIKMLWDGDVLFDELLPVTGAAGLEPVDKDTNFQHFLEIFYPDFPTNFIPLRTLDFTNTGNADLTVYAPSYDSSSTEWSFYYMTDEGLVEWNNQDGFVVAPGKTVSVCGFLNFINTGWRNYNIVVNGDSTLKVSGYMDALIDSGLSHGSVKMQDYEFVEFFRGCSQLVDASELILPTELTDGCYRGMFNTCTSLVKTPKLKSMIMKRRCYQSMFYNCTSLVEAPELPALELSDRCYNGMFEYCEGLTQAPELPSTTLAPYCYYYMFHGCTSLEKAPELPATVLIDGCYQYMFTGCTNLNYIKCKAISNSKWCCDGWLEEVSETGTFVKAEEAEWDEGSSGIPSGWTIQDEGSITKEIHGTLKLRQQGSISIYLDEDGLSGWYNIWVTPSKSQTLFFSTDNVYWQLYKKGDIYHVNPGQTVYVCGKLEGDDNDDENHTHFNITREHEEVYIDLSGNINSLWDYTDLTKHLHSNCGYCLFQYCNALYNISNLIIPTADAYMCYDNAFKSCNNLFRPPQLPATTLADGCYRYMFYNCRALTEIPELPATTLADGCYRYMFYNCNNLGYNQTNPIILPAILLTNDCYVRMFERCPYIKYIKCLAINPDSNNCYRWLQNGSSTGTFVKAAGVNWERSISGIPSGWTVEEETVILPDIPTTGDVLDIKGSVCVEQLDGEDFLLGFINEPEQKIFISVDNIHWNVYDGQLYNVHGRAYVCGILSKKVNGSSRFFIQGSNIRVSGVLASMWNYNDLDQQLYEYCGSDMFYNCTALVDASELVFPDTTSNGCYSRMFYGCTNILHAPELPALELSYDCYSHMFESCTSLEKAPDLLAPRLVSYCYNEMFFDCTNLNYIKCMATYLHDPSEYPPMYGWTVGVAKTGTFICAEEMDETSADWDRGEAGIPNGWVVPREFNPNIDMSPENYIVFENIGDEESYLGIRTINSSSHHVYISKDTQHWQLVETLGDYFFDMGEKFYVCGQIISAPSLQFSLPIGQISVSGPLTGLWNYEDLTQPLYDMCGFALFDSCTALTDASNLVFPVTTSNNCYVGMFSSCTNLVSAPELPATELSSSCYQSMFGNCTSLTTAPDLPATEAIQYCYLSMFAGCTSLVNPPTISLTTTARACCCSMFNGCTSLTQGPDLLSQNLVDSCYDNMFTGCTSLKRLRCLGMPNLAATRGWLGNVPNSPNCLFIKHPDANWDRSFSGIPSSWTVINDGDPEPEPPEPGDYSVYVESYEGSKLHFITSLKTIMSWELRYAKEFVDSLPNMLREGTSYEEACSLAQQVYDAQGNCVVKDGEGNIVETYEH